MEGDSPTLSNTGVSTYERYTSQITIAQRTNETVEKQPLAKFLDISSLWKFRKMHRKTPLLGSLFNKVAGLQICNLFKNKPLTHVFPVDIVKFLRTALFIENLWWPLLTVLPQ